MPTASQGPLKGSGSFATAEGRTSVHSGTLLKGKASLLKAKASGTSLPKSTRGPSSGRAGGENLPDLGTGVGGGREIINIPYP